MRRSLRSALLVFTLLASHVTFLAVVAFGAPCPERCADDGPDGRCPPACMACPCAPRPASLTPAVTVTEPPARHDLLPALVALAPCEPRTTDIFHVPKPLLA